jgi:MOSC domain-containing protein YiiM
MQVFTTGRITDIGLEGNFFARLDKIQKSSRQVTITSHEQWHEAMEEIEQELPWYERRSNLCITGHSFTENDVGGCLLIGRSAILEITGELEPCDRMDAIYPGLQEALRSPFRGGVTCRVIYPGTIDVGDGITRFN